MAQRGRPPNPVELHKQRGTYRPDRHSPKPNVVLVPPVDTPPDPPRPLGPAGRALWNRIWDAGRTWIAPSDLDLVLLVAESTDERVALRLRMLRGGGDWRDRVALRALDAQIASILSALAFTPADRSRLGVAEVRATALEELLGHHDDDGA